MITSRIRLFSSWQLRLSIDKLLVLSQYSIFNFFGDTPYFLRPHFYSFSLMEIPPFLLADNTDLPDDVFIIHTEYPRFVWNVSHDNVEWLDELEGEEDELVNEIATILDAAQGFYEREMQRHEAELI